jgi:pSer/pThr/pTyr-binding forkhead associated (FHA) protein
MPAPVLESSAGIPPALRLEAGTRWLIGTDPRCSLQLPPGSAEPFHCEVFFSSRRWQVRDLLSATGTLVNGTAVEQQPLASGDVIQVGKEKLTFVLDDRSVAARTCPGSSSRAALSRRTLHGASPTDGASVSVHASASAARRVSSAAQTVVASLVLFVSLAAAVAILSGIFGTSGT